MVQDLSEPPIPVTIMGPMDSNEEEEYSSEPIPIKEEVLDTELITAEEAYSVKIEIIDDDYVEDESDGEYCSFIDETDISENTIRNDGYNNDSLGTSAEESISLQCSQYSEGCPISQEEDNKSSDETAQDVEHNYATSNKNIYCQDPETSGEIADDNNEITDLQTSNVNPEFTYDNQRSSESNNDIKDQQQESLNKVRNVRYQCSYCPKSYAHYSILCLHKHRRHSEEERTAVNTRLVNSNDGGSPAQCSRFVERIPGNENTCPVCLNRFSSISYLRKHMRRHANDIDKYHCDQCNTNFRGKSALTRHIRVIHEGEKRFPCSYCKRRFSTKQAQIYHERRHTGESPHVCPLCSKAYVDKQSLGTHMRRHATNKNWKRSSKIRISFNKNNV